MLRTPHQERWRVTNCRDQFVPNWSCAISMIVESSYEFGFVLSQLLWESELRANIFFALWLSFYFYFFRGPFSRAENFVIFYQGLWAENVNILVQNSPTLFFFFFFTFISRVFSLFLRDFITFEIKFSNIFKWICIYRLYQQILVNPR